MNKLINEGKAIINVPIADKVSRAMEVFYNPVMKFNRDISVLLLGAIDKQKLQIALPLAGTGVRGIRLIKELKANKIKEMSINDHSENAVKLIKENVKLNKIRSKIKVSNKDGTLFLLESSGFDYIDIDPFGSPNPFLDSAVKRLAMDGILAITATDTSALCGSYPDACLRKYWAVPLRTELMHEIGLRILVRKAQLIAAQYEKALIPIFCYSKDHYMRAFFRCDKSKNAATSILEQHSLFHNSGPIWTGKLWDRELVKKMVKLNKIEENHKFLEIIEKESGIDSVGFIDIHKLGKITKKEIPSKESVLRKIKENGYLASETHISPLGIKSNIPEDKILGLFD